MSSSKKLFLIDASSYAYRYFYALPQFSTSKGKPTNVLFGFSKLILKYIKSKKDLHIAIAMDSPKPTFRHKLYEEYKIQRQPMPDDLSVQIPLLKKMFDTFNIKYFEKEGFEADDIIATLAKKAEDNNWDVDILTGDKDMLQLISKKVKVVSTHKEDYTYDIDKVKERFKVEPKKILDIMALMGDNSDNIPGVPGIGEKRAIELIKEFGSLSGLYKKLDKVKLEKIKANLKEYKKQAEMSYELARIDTSVPLKIDLDECKVPSVEFAKAQSFFKEYEFKSLLEILYSLQGKKDEARLVQEGHVKYRVIRDFKECKKVTEEILKSKSISISIASSSDSPMKAECYGFSVYTGKDKSYYFTITLLGVFISIMDNDSIVKYIYNLKYFLIMMKRMGVEPKGKFFDIMLGQYVLNSAKMEKKKWFGASERETCELAYDVWSKKDEIEKLLTERNQMELLEKIEMPLSRVLIDMEMTGVLIDEDFLKGLSNILDRNLKGIIKDIYKFAGEEFNINSPKQLGKILFDKLKLAGIKKTKSGYSTAVDVLERLAFAHELPAKVLEYRQLAKLKNTYVDTLPGLINPETGRLHTSFNQTGTVTGRLSSSDPNLQNIPIKTDIGKEIRRAFITDKGIKILSADYSQIDLRVLAHIANEPELIKAFKNNQDIHTATAAGLFNVGVKKVDNSMRRVAKVVNFGLIYGMSPFGLSKELKILRKEAEDYIENYFVHYPKVKKYMENIVKKAGKNGYVTTLLGRRRYLPELNDRNKNIRGFGERAAINMPIQGTASDLIKVAMVNIYEIMKKKRYKTKMILQIHDELLFEVPDEEIGEIKTIVKKEMEDAMKLKVPLKVDIKYGKNWYEAK